MINGLANHADPIYRQSLIAELNAYARFHFLSEENLMYKSGYPGWQSHKQLHLQLIDELSSKQSRLLLNGDRQAPAGIINFLSDWFIHHTTEEDRRFADYLHNRQ